MHGQTGRIEGALSFHDHVEGLQLLDRIGRDYMRMFISYYGLPYPESNCGRCGEYPGTMGAKHGVKNEGILIDCPSKMDPCSFCKVVFSCVPDVGVKMLRWEVLSFTPLDATPKMYALT